MTEGIGWAPCHHGELLQGFFRDATGATRRGLVTLPMTGPGTRAHFTRTEGGPLLAVPGERAKARRAAELALWECARRRRCPPGGGRLQLGAGVPVGLGMGSSTSDVIAAVRAVFAAFGLVADPGTTARIAVRAERACDPLMLGGGPLLFAQRDGEVLEELGAALPPLAVVGCLTGGGRPVDTLALAADRAADVAGYERLRGALRTAVADGDAALLGRVSTASARLNQRVLAKAELPALERLAEHVGAVGVQVAHSGNVAGLLFDATTPDFDRRVRAGVRGLRREGITATRVFRAQQRASGGRAWTSTSPKPSAGRTWCGPVPASSASDSRR
ncbi:GHMP kinase [Saccharopolyspora cebuensis]|uniref:GHMP family kinase ATP-binding protein n=1 Tax=Saccharopolyspora cebuensis TaxID=418759 RepID=UPI0031EFD99D